jgi:hypothetical protein
MGNDREACEITHMRWGEVEIMLEGKHLTFKDCKLWPGGARSWDWGETGTEHKPGIQPSDIEEILNNGAEVVILGVGVFSRLKVCPETEKTLKERGIKYHILETNKATKLFNQLSKQGKKAGALIHTTC